MPVCLPVCLPACLQPPCSRFFAAWSTACTGAAAVVVCIASRYHACGAEGNIHETQPPKFRVTAYEGLDNEINTNSNIVFIFFIYFLYELINSLRAFLIFTFLMPLRLFEKSFFDAILLFSKLIFSFFSKVIIFILSTAT